VDILDPHLQNIFIENIQKNIQDRLAMMKFPTFLHLCTTYTYVPFTYGDPNRKFTPLPDTLHNTMTQILGYKIINLPPIRTLDTNKPLPLNFKSNAYYHFHRQNRDEMKHCKHLKHIVQDVIDVGRLIVKGVNDQGNNFLSPPNQNL
jgi:hypothetical protein